MTPINHPEHYPDNWPEIRSRIIARSGDRCECVAECGLHPGNRCVEVNHTPAMFAKGQIVLTIAHLDCDAGAGNHSDDNLKAMCQRCHNRMDAPSRALHRATNRRARMAAQGQEDFSARL